MKSAKKPDISAIYPLTFMQQGLLFHHLTSPVDQGLLLVQFDIEGTIKFEYFKKAWKNIVLRHEILRTTVHWENLDKAVIVVHKNKEIKINISDWTLNSPEENKRKWEALKSDSFIKGINFKDDPLLHIEIVTVAPGAHRLLWPCHHLLLDGWSSNTIIREVMESYDQLLIDDATPSLVNLPSYKSYLNWVNEMYVKDDGTFWINYFKGFKKSHFFGRPVIKDSFKTNTYNLSLSEEETNELRLFAKKNKVTLNTILQGAWSLLLSRYFGVTDIVHGTTVSGRSVDFNDIHLLSGMFVNVQPVRNTITDKNQPFADWFNENQKIQQKALNYEYMGLDRILSAMDSNGIETLFDSLFVFENYPNLELATFSLKTSNFRSGITSTYPVTMVTIPYKKMQFVLTLLTDHVNDASGTWLKKNYHNILINLISGKAENYNQLTSLISVFKKDSSPSNAVSEKQIKNIYTPVKNKIEKELLEIWESLFGITGLSTNDNFFELGGKSLQAIKLFSLIEARIGKRLQPATLLERPTIAELGEMLSDDVKVKKWKFLVALKTAGNKPPLFCVHAGGGHVFFYNQLAQLMNVDRPVYALQPLGLDVSKAMHQSIELMAEDYLSEMRALYPNGPYNIMVYCFSTAVGVEMATQIERLGAKANLIIMDTMAEQVAIYTKSRLLMRTKYFVKRIIKEPVITIKTMFLDRIQRYLKPLWVSLKGSEEEIMAEKIRSNLGKVYIKYQWKTYPIKVTVILTEKSEKSFNTEIIDSWGKLAEKGVRIIYTQGNHRTLFEEPDVAFTAEILENHLEKNI